MGWFGDILGVLAAPATLGLSLAGVGGKDPQAVDTPLPSIPGYQGYTPTGNQDPLHNLEGFASGHGDSPWAQAQLDALKQAGGQAQGNAATTAGAASTQAEDNAAAHGGVTTGMAANLAANRARNMSNARQGVWGQMLGQQGQIRSEDEKNRLGVAQALPGQEVQSMQPGMEEQGMQNTFNMGNYQAQLQQAASKDLAAAQKNQGKK